MRDQKQTIWQIVGFHNNPGEEGGFWLPNIQRPFVWSEEQICRLFDSILPEYPISTLLVWKYQLIEHHCCGPVQAPVCPRISGKQSDVPS